MSGTDAGTDAEPGQDNGQHRVPSRGLQRLAAQEPLMNAATGGDRGNQQDPLASLLGAAQTAAANQSAAGTA